MRDQRERKEIRFQYFSDSEPVKIPQDSLIVSLPVMRSEKEIMDAYYNKLNFPSYFGFNWDALWDCLWYLEWIEQDNIIIVHEELPELEGREMWVYLNTLNDAMMLEEGKYHNFIVYFPDSDRDKIFQVIDSDKYDPKPPKKWYWTRRF